MNKNYLLLVMLILITEPLFAQDLPVNGNIQLNHPRSTILTQGDLSAGHRGGMQFLTFNNGTDFIVQPTDLNANPVNSTFRLGGFGDFSSNTVNLAVTGTTGIGILRPSANFHVYSPGSTNPINAMKIEVATFTTIANANNSSFLTVRDIGSGTTAFIIKGNGNVGVGTSSPDALLAVKGAIHANEVRVDLSVPGPDYVFESDYKLASLEEIKNYIDQNKHLPEIPSAKEMEKNGVQLGEMNMLLLKKIEELTLHILEQERKIQEQEKRIQRIEKNK